MNVDHMNLSLNKSLYKANIKYLGFHSGSVIESYYCFWIDEYR